MKRLLVFLLMLPFIVATAQETVTLKFNRPANFQGSMTKIRIMILDNEYTLKNGSSISANVECPSGKPLRIDCRAGLAGQSSFSFIPTPNQTYEFEVGFKVGGLYIDLLSGDKVESGELNNAGALSQSESIREEWLKKGGTVNYISVLGTGTYLRLDMAKSGLIMPGSNSSIIKGYGGGYSFSSNFINLKMPEYTSGKSKWNSLNWGIGLDFVIYGFSLPTYESTGMTMDMSIMSMNMRIVGNFGYTIAQGKYIDEATWKGVAFTVKYRPSFDYTYSGVTTKTTFDPPNPFVPNGTNYTSSSNKQVNMGGFGVDLDFTSFSAKMAKLAPKPKIKVSFFMLPPVGKNPLFMSLSLGVTFYPRNQLNRYKHAK